ncbi:hypothetical protein ATEIFO6365_0004036100 [Aspergillus terreus]|uniref:Uncharacterized protein n=1 Tax=Aspergillus terreus TaxID=33178 RepID=A0A5M3YP10_ASPTE|nr:hypothetical protein ATETN484_0002038600 [Aspergillus terreus]GFF15242.1 hypothetical protein ATEIFO6365_0004036100 [Aspergillus terreus]
MTTITISFNSIFLHPLSVPWLHLICVLPAKICRNQQKDQKLSSSPTPSLMLSISVHVLYIFCRRLVHPLSTSCRDHVLSVTMPKFKATKRFECGRNGHRRADCPVMNAARTLETPDTHAPFYRQVQEAKKQRKETPTFSAVASSVVQSSGR